MDWSKKLINSWERYDNLSLWSVRQSIGLGLNRGSEPIAYIGETTDVSGRLRSHEKKFGSDALFSIAPVDGLSRPERHELELDLIGAHYLALGKSPVAQFGRTDHVPLGD